MQNTEKALKANVKKIISGILVLALVMLAIEGWAGDTARAAADGMIRVRLTRLGSGLTSLAMVPTGPYSVNGTAISSGATVSATLSGGVISVRSGGTTLTSGTSVTLSRGVGGVGCGLTFTSPSVSNLYCGDLTLSVSGGAILPVLRIYVETYLYGVVAYEMSNSFPIEALKAQAVTARTYAMRAKSSGGNYDLTDNTSSQVFRGYSSNYANVISAVNQTAGMCLTYGGKYAQCYYTASNGGQIESTKNAWGSDVAYLTVKDDPYDLSNPSSVVKTHVISKKTTGANTLTAKLESALIQAAASALSAAGMSTSEASVQVTDVLSVTPHTPRFDAPSRTYTKLRFTYLVSDGQKSVRVEADLGTYSQLESMLNLSINSSDNEIVGIEETDEAFVLSFRRYGHGIGMSQRGAQWMAGNAGMGYQAILSFYYSGTTLEALGLADTSGSGASPTVTVGPTATPTEDGYVTLREGDTGDAVKAMQQRLKELGYFMGTPLGNFKTLTLDAVKAYQAAMGLAADGVATPELQRLIFGKQTTPDATPEQTPTATGRYARIALGGSGSRMYIRQGPSTDTASLGLLSHGDRVEVLAAAGEWTSIRAGSVVGYVKTQYLEMEAAATATPAATAAGEAAYAVVSLGSASTKLNVRSAAGTSAKVLGVVENGTRLQVLAKGAEWSYVTNGALTGYVSNDYLRFESATATPVPAATATPAVTMTATPSVTVAPTAAPSVASYATVKLGSTSARLNVRSAGSTGAKVLGTVKHGARLQVLERGEEWTRIQSGTLTGYVSSAYLSFEGSAATTAPVVTATPTPTPTATVLPSSTSAVYATVTLGSSDGRMNIRAEQSTSSPIVGLVRHGDRIMVLRNEGTWCNITNGVVYGYVKTQYLTFENAAIPATATPAAVATPTPTPTVAPTVGETEKYRILRTGDTGDAVKALQRQLKALGYFNGDIGGNYLTKTTAAVRAFQAKMLLTEDGIATDEVQRLLFADDAPRDSANAVYRYVNVGANDTLTLRASDSASASALTAIENGVRVQALASLEGWTRVVYGGQAGYVASRYLSERAPETATPQTTAQVSDEANATVAIGGNTYLNMRSEPSTDAKIVCKLYKGDRVTVVGTSGDWAQLEYRGSTGYAKMEYIRKDS